jgi:hypothetical protein
MCLEKLEGPKGIFKIRKLKIDLQHNEQKKKDKMTNKIYKNTTLKIEQHKTR